MRISELARESDVPVATIKFYLREHLLPEGTRTAATQAQYSEEHLARLRLIRALVGAGGLSLAAVRRVLDALEHPPERFYDVVCVAGEAVSPAADPVDHARVHALLAGWGAREEDCRAHDDLAAAVEAATSAEFPLEDEALEEYQRQMTALARREIDGVPTTSAAEAVRYVVLGTVLVEPVLLALRRLAHRQLTAERFVPDERS